MDLQTCARGQRTCLTIRKEDLQTGAELEALPLPIDVSISDPQEHGTAVRLSSLAQHWNYPSAERLKELLVLEYGREEGFQIVVNGNAVGIEDVRGTPSTAEAVLPTAGAVRLRLRITDDQQPPKQAGIALRVGGKIIGRPSYFGLDLANDVPLRLLRRVYGEVEADDLSEDISGLIQLAKCFGTCRYDDLAVSFVVVFNRRNYWGLNGGADRRFQPCDQSRARRQSVEFRGSFHDRWLRRSRCTGVARASGRAYKDQGGLRQFVLHGH